MPDNEQSLFSQWRIHILETLTRLDSRVDALTKDFEEFRISDAKNGNHAEKIQVLGDDIKDLKKTVSDVRIAFRAIAWVGGLISMVIVGVLISYFSGLITKGG